MKADELVSRMAVAAELAGAWWDNEEKERGKMEGESTKQLADSMAKRARQGVPISAAEYRQLFILGLSYMLRELDSISYKLHKLEQQRDL